MNHLKQSWLTMSLPVLLMFPLITGCGMQAHKPSLSGTSWWIEDIAGNGVIDYSRTTISFGEAGRVSGSTGCNRYTGSAEVDAARLKFGPMAGTRKMCPPAPMDQEFAFYQAMAKVDQWEIGKDGLLYLTDAGGQTQLRASETDTP